MLERPSLRLTRTDLLRRGLLGLLGSVAAGRLLVEEAASAATAPGPSIRVRDVRLGAGSRDLEARSSPFNLLGLHWQGSGSVWFRTRDGDRRGAWQRAVVHELVATAWRAPVNRLGEPLPHGIGWFVQTYNGELVVWQFGATPGASSALVVRVPNRRLTLIALANSDGLTAPFPMTGGDVTVSPIAMRSRSSHARTCAAAGRLASTSSNSSVARANRRDAMGRDGGKLATFIR